MKRAFVLFVMLVACGGGATPEARTVNAPPPTGKPAPLTEPNDAQKSALEYVIVPESFAVKYGPAPAADVKTWSELPANRGAIKTEVRHILCRGADGKKKCDALLARLAKEDFAKVARDKSDEPDVAKDGPKGLGPDASALGDAAKTAGDALAPGETSKQALETPRGWVILRKDPASDELLASAYRKAKAPEVTKKLADEILARFKTSDSARAAIASAVEAVLGDQAEADPARPHPMLIEPPRIDQLHVPQETMEKLKTFAKTGHAGEGVDAPLPAIHGLVVARVWAPPAR